MKSEFSKPRDRSSCGLIKDALGRQLVAVVGGATGGQGMEFWYPGKFFNVVFRRISSNVECRLLVYVIRLTLTRLQLGDVPTFTRGKGLLCKA